MPVFSIVLTTTRPRLVGGAIQSVIDQDYKDFELIVSDNSEVGCKDIVESFSDPRIKYVRPKEYMTVVEHWEFAFLFAKGEWQTLLCDDDAYIPSFLTKVKSEIEKENVSDIVTWGFAGFYDNNWHIPNERNKLIIPYLNSKCKIYKTKKIIEEMFKYIPNRGEVKQKIPYIVNSVYSKRLIDKIRGKLEGKLFLPICPMTSASLAALSLSDKVLRIMKPLIILGTPNDSAGAHMSDSSTLKKMTKGFDFKYTDINSIHIFPAVMVETMLVVQRKLSELNQYKINMVNYFIACKDAINGIKNNGVDIRNEIEIYNKALLALPEKTIYKINHKTMFFEKISSKILLLYRFINAPSKTRKYVNGKTIDTEVEKINTRKECGEFLQLLLNEI